MNEYVVRVRCRGTTLFAFVLDGTQRFITFDHKPRLLTRDDALEIQQRLPAGPAGSAVSIERAPAHEMAAQRSAEEPRTTSGDANAPAART